MLRSGLFRRGFSVCLLALAPVALWAQDALTHEGGRWVETITGTVPPAARLRIQCQGPVRLEAGTASAITYTAKLSVRAASEVEARRRLAGFVLRAFPAGEWTVLNAGGGSVSASLDLRTPKLSGAVISTTEGSIEANGIDGFLTANSGAGELRCDRIAGDSRLITGGGEILAGQVGGGIRASTGGGRIVVKSVGGDAVLETAGGDIQVTDAGAAVRADTAGGSVRVHNAGGSVTASTGGGPIIIDKAAGIVITRNMAGPVQIGAATGVRSESGTGGIRLNNIAGPIRVSTAEGNIMASLLAGQPPADSFLATGDGDITVVIPSNVGVNIRAENDLADSLRRIVSDFPDIPVRMRGTHVVAEGAINGGGPLLRISGTGGTIFIKRQR